MKSRANKKSLIIFPGFYVPHIGGLETHVDEFSRFLGETNKYEITIFAPRIPSSSPERELRWKNVKVIRYPAVEIVKNYPIPKFWTLSFWKLFFDLYHQHFDIVMTRTRFFFNTFLGLLFSKLRKNKIKLVHVEHGSSYVFLSNRLKTFFAYLYDITLGKLVLMAADKVVAISEAVKEFLISEFNIDEKKIVLIYRGVDFNRFYKIKKRKCSSFEFYNHFKSKVKFCCVGRLYKWKGFDNVIKAFLSLPKNLREHSLLVIVGDGEEKENLHLLSKSYKNILFLGELSFEDTLSVVSCCDVFIHSSYKGGGLSSSLLEAMFLGKIIIASPFEGGKEVIINRKRGFLLKSNSPLEIKKAMVEVIKNFNKWSFLGRNAKKFVEREFKWQRSIEKYLILFESL